MNRQLIGFYIVFIYFTEVRLFLANFKLKKALNKKDNYAKRNLVFLLEAQYCE